MAGFCKQLTTTTCAYPAISIKVKASTNDTIPIVGTVSQSWTIDVTIVRTAREPLALTFAFAILTEMSILGVSLVST